MAAYKVTSKLIYPKITYDKLTEKNKNLLIDNISKIIKKYYYDEPDIAKFIYYIGKIGSKYNLKICDALNQVIFSVASGINLSLSLIDAKSNNPNKEYMDFSISIIQELMSETEFDLY